MKNSHDTRLHQRHEAATENAYQRDDTFPLRYVFVLTSSCNLNCPFCFQKNRAGLNRMDQGHWISLLDQIPGDSRITITGGEPLLFKGFKDVFTHIASRFDCNLITNGLLLTCEVIDMLLSHKRFKALSLSIDDIGNRVRGVAPDKWEKFEKIVAYFLHKKRQQHPSCVLDVKTTLLKSNAQDLFTIHRYVKEKLGCDTHGFQFLKGSPLQHDNRMHGFESIFKGEEPSYYPGMKEIHAQLEQIRRYNVKHNGQTFLHPGFASLSSPSPLKHLNDLLLPLHDPKLFKPCKYPWSSVHINSDGHLFPCLSVSMGNVMEKPLTEIFSGQNFKRFKKVIRENGTVPACHRCGWLKPVSSKAS